MAEEHLCDITNKYGEGLSCSAEDEGGGEVIFCGGEWIGNI
jgi:hypothetical protein